MAMRFDFMGVGNHPDCANVHGQHVENEGLLSGRNIFGKKLLSHPAAWRGWGWGNEWGERGRQRKSHLWQGLLLRSVHPFVGE